MMNYEEPMTQNEPINEAPPVSEERVEYLGVSLTPAEARAILEQQSKMVG